MTSAQPTSPQRLTRVQWLICTIAVIGFAFDIYELLMMPLIAGPAISELLGVPPFDPAVPQWIGRIFWASALSGGAFGLLGGWLTDKLGRRRVLTWSILIYSFSALAAAFSTNIWHLLIFRCTTFIGVCVEFVAAVAWLAELFDDPKQRERVLGFTQAFSSVGGLLVTGANVLAVKYAASLPAIGGSHSSWRYTLISGLVPAIPLIIIRPFLPESPKWQAKRDAGTLRRPRFRELFSPELRRTTIVTTILFACCYGAAFGGIQLTPTAIVPGLPELADASAQEAALRIKALSLRQQMAAEPAKKNELAPELEETRKALAKVGAQIRQEGNRVQFWQEMGGLCGRTAIAFLVVLAIARGKLLRYFLVPGLVLLPFVFWFPGSGSIGSAGPSNLAMLQMGLFAAGFLTVAQFSFWGNYLPRMYPVYLRGTGEGFAANVGGRMIGTSMGFVTTNLVAPYLISPLMPEGTSTFDKVAYAAAIVVGGVYLVALIVSFWLPEPAKEELPE